jgi:hypothetical protein
LVSLFADVISRSQTSTLTSVYSGFITFNLGQPMINYDQARKRVVDTVLLDVNVLAAGNEIIIVDEATIERPWGWVFFYTSRKWHETRDVRYALAGNAPLIVDKTQGDIYVTGTAYPIAYYIANYERHGDPHVIEIPAVRMTGWRQGALAISAITLVREHSGLGLADAKKIVESCLAYQPTVVTVADVQIAKSLIVALDAVGFSAEVCCDRR